MKLRGAALLGLVALGCAQIGFWDPVPDGGPDSALLDASFDAQAKDGDVDGSTADSAQDASDSGHACVPAGDEVCNGIDDNCDDQVDEECDCRDGWIWSNPRPTGLDLYDVWVSSDGMTAVAVGAAGIIVAKNGPDIEPIDSGTSADLQAIDGRSATELVAVGTGGTILEFDGSTWTSAVSGTTSDLEDVWVAPDDGSAIAVGQNGIVLRRSAGSWSELATLYIWTQIGVWGFDSSHFYVANSNGEIHEYVGGDFEDPVAVNGSATGIWGTAPNNLFAVGFFGRAFRYQGVSWMQMTTGLEPYSTQFNALAGVSSSDVLAVADSGHLLGYNGTAWSEHNLSLPGGPNLNGIARLSSGDAVIVGDDGLLLEYDPDSFALENLRTGFTDSLRAIDVSSEGRVLAVGSSGALVEFADEEWVVLDSDTDETLNAIDLTEFPWLIVGSNGTALASEDGDSWEPLALPSAIYPLYGIWRSPSSEDIFLVGENGRIYHYTEALGWVIEASGTTEPLKSIAGLDAATVYAVGSAGTVLRYDGDAWEPIAGPSGWPMWFEDAWVDAAGDLHVVGQGSGVHRWNGTMWSSALTDSGHNFSSIWGDADGRIIAVGSVVATFDGVDWSLTDLPGVPAYAVGARNANDVFLVGDGGTVMRHCGADWL